MAEAGSSTQQYSPEKEQALQAYRRVRTSSPPPPPLVDLIIIARSLGHVLSC